MMHFSFFFTQLSSSCLLTHHGSAWISNLPYNTDQKNIYWAVVILLIMGNKFSKYFPSLLVFFHSL